MEKIILDYIVDNINRNKNKEALNNDVLLLEAMVENNKIEDDYTILLKDSNEKIDLREFLEKIYKETSNKKIMDILSSNKLAGKTSNNFSYLLLMDKIEELKEELDEEKIKKVLDDFFTGSKNKKIANYLVEDGETKLFSLLLKYILTSSKGLFLFKTLFFDFLKIEKSYIENYISNNFKLLDIENGKETLIDLCNEYSFLRKVELKNKKRKDISISFIELFVSENPDIINTLKIDEEEKNSLVDFYFKEKVEVKRAYFYEYHDILKMKKDWFKKKGGNRDLISILMQNKDLNIELFINDIEKNIDLKKYLIERKENVIIEYIMNAKKIKKSMYNKLKKNLPELIERGNKIGILNYPSNYFFYSDNFDFIKDLPSQILMTNNDQELWKWATTENLVYFRCNENDRKKLSVLFYNSIKKNFKDRETQLFEDAFNIVRMQDLLYSSCYDTRIVDQSELMWLMKQSKVSAEKLESVKAIQSLLSEGKLKEETLLKFKIQEEKNILSEIIVKKEENEVIKKDKKRI